MSKLNTPPTIDNSFFEKAAFKKIKRLLCEATRVNFDGYRDEYLKRRLSLRLKATGSTTYNDYVCYLKKNPAECNLLLNDFAINYTMFFRDPDVFTYIEKVLLPKLFAAKVVRIWSAGCATGEEPYSIAILIHRLLGYGLSRHQVIIFASDIDKDALTKAENGVYNRNQLQPLNEKELNLYFQKENELYRIRDHIRKLIKFERHDLTQPSIHRTLDLILCRNVMIYFSKESQQKIHMHFYDALRTGGYLITGRSEVLTGEPSQKFQCIDIKCRIYKKPPLVNLLTHLGDAQQIAQNNPRFQKTI